MEPQICSKAGTTPIPEPGIHSRLAAEDKPGQPMGSCETEAQHSGRSLMAELTAHNSVRKTQRSTTEHRSTCSF